MKNILTDGLHRCLGAVRGRGAISAKMLDDILADLRLTLLDADVALEVTDYLLAEIRAGSAAISNAVMPERELLKLISNSLLTLLGDAEDLSLRARPPVVVLLVGLQGVGKTTTAGKLATLLRNRRKLVMLASCDASRPAAVEQLEILAERAGVQFYRGDAAAGAARMASDAMQAARKKLIDVLLIDTAGRGQLQHDLMQELSGINSLCKPAEVLFVCDSAMGQEGIRVAAGFAEAVPVSGVILTRVDGDSRGGVALSVRHVLAKPIKFIGTGESLDALENFVPERFVNLLLGRGDLAALASSIATRPATAIAKPGRKGISFVQLAEQMHELQQVGGLAAMADKLPGGMAIPEGSEQRMRHMLAAIDSMTTEEKHNPQLLNASRRKRIARGSGTSVQLVNQLAKMQKGGSKMYKRMRGLSPHNIGRFIKSLPGL